MLRDARSIRRQDFRPDVPVACMLREASLGFKSPLVGDSYKASLCGVYGRNSAASACDCGQGSMGLRVNPFRLRIIHIAAVYSVLAILSFFLLAPLLKFYAFLATVAHSASSSQCKRPGRPLAPQSATHAVI